MEQYSAIKNDEEGQLAGSVQRAYDFWPQGRKFKFRIGYRDYLNKTSKKWCGENFIGMIHEVWRDILKCRLNPWIMQGA